MCDIFSDSPGKPTGRITGGDPFRGWNTQPDSLLKKR
jgi:hypothetical protein